MSGDELDPAQYPRAREWRNARGRRERQPQREGPEGLVPPHRRRGERPPRAGAADYDFCTSRGPGGRGSCAPHSAASSPSCRGFRRGSAPCPPRSSSEARPRRSSGRRSTLPDFVDAVLIAPPADPDRYVGKFARLFGISDPTRDSMQARLMSRYGTRWEDLRADRPSRGAGCRLLVVHDGGEAAVPVGAGWPSWRAGATRFSCAPRGSGTTRSCASRAWYPRRCGFLRSPTRVDDAPRMLFCNGNWHWAFVGSAHLARGGIGRVTAPPGTFPAPQGGDGVVRSNYQKPEGGEEHS